MLPNFHSHNNVVSRFVKLGLFLLFNYLSRTKMIYFLINHGVKFDFECEYLQKKLEEVKDDYKNENMFVLYQLTKRLLAPFIEYPLSFFFYFILFFFDSMKHFILHEFLLWYPKQICNMIVIIFYHIFRI